MRIQFLFIWLPYVLNGREFDIFHSIIFLEVWKSYVPHTLCPFKTFTMVFVIELVLTLFKNLLWRISQIGWELWEKIHALFLELCMNVIIIRKATKTTILNFFLVFLLLIKRSTKPCPRNWKRRDKNSVLFSLITSYKIFCLLTNGF